MNGLLLLQDLEDDDQKEPDPEYNFNYKSQTKRSKERPVHHKNRKKEISIGDPQGNNRKKEVNDPLMVDGHLHPNRRRKSISAEPLPPGDYSHNHSNGVGNHGNHGLSNGSHANGGDYGGYGPINGHFSSLSSVNNAITVAPSRTTFLEPNVFAGGRSNPHHRKHKKHKNHDEGGGYQSILNKIDHSILKNFGDWTNMDDEGGRNNRSNHNNNNNNNNNNHQNHNNLHNSNNSNNRTSKVPYFIPKHSDPDEEALNISNDDAICLPKLYKSYDSVVQLSNKVLNDKSHRIAMSKDNTDPNSILSEAKRTLAKYGGCGD